ncbi:MAG: mucoidy inhibitor MuiA family protein [Erysipelotrichaceae bacterium]|nr:mucoidy inhibitor MuiA family protein [Erysipelotrichaceae bacterium]
MTVSNVKEVSVYRSGAFVLRTGTVTLEAGKQTVRIEKLPASLDTSTVRLSLPQNVSGTNVQVEVFTKEEKEEFLKPITDKIKRAENRLTIKNNQIEMWNANADFSSKESLSIADMSEYIEKLPARIEKIYEEIDELNAEIKQLNKELRDKKIEVGTYLVKVDITAEKAGEYPFELRYFESKATWYPVYEIHTAESEEENLSLRLKAKIAQQTSEDWNNVKVTLFTGNPSASGTIPELSPTRVGFYNPNVYRNYAMGAAKSAAPMMMAMAESARIDEDYELEDGAVEDTMEMEEVYAPRASVKQNDTMMEYELGGTWDISKENEITADISANNIDCRYHIVAIPKMDDTGYLAAEVKTADIEEILQSNAIIYHKGAYLGEVYLNADLSKEKYDISLGRDESIKLKRKQERKYTSNVMLKGQKKTEYEFEIKVTSTKQKPCNVTLLDQVPVSTDKTIVIENTKLSNGEFNEKTGEVKWEFELGASETKTFELDYSISWPKDKNLNI